MSEADLFSRPLEFWQMVGITLVLLGALYMVVDTVRWQRRTRERKKALCQIASEGEELKAGLLAVGSSIDSKEAALAAERWMKATASMLEGYSAEAVKYFERLPTPGSSAVEIVIQRIENLKDISERPDIYYS